VTRAVALFSGGLDSQLAVVLVKNLGVDVTALTFATCFGCGGDKPGGCGYTTTQMADRLGVSILPIDLGQSYVDMVVNPRFGRGKHMNPCIDCRIMMLRTAKSFLDEVGADFLITGEVLGQRPMSQRRDAIALVDRETGFGEIILRPLSAKLLPITKPERDGLVDRELLCDIQGRSRHRQITLAEKLGITDYPTSAGGCLLTDEGFSRRLSDLLRHVDNPVVRDIELLKLGRHFRTPNGAKIIVGRNESENDALERLAGEGTPRLIAIGVGSPLTLVIGTMDDETKEAAARITARYSSGRTQVEVEVDIETTSKRETLVVPTEPPTCWRDWVL
jgi:tRNA-specific 2-thiouridylase